MALVCSALLACTPDPAADGRNPPHVERSGAATPAEAVSGLLDHLRHNDLAGMAEAALPADLHAEVDAAWRRGDSRWPLTELPLDDNIPKLLAALSGPQAESTLNATFKRQMSGQTRALQEAARGLGMFGKEYLGREGDYNADQRQHYTQLIDAFAGWAAQAPLGDPGRGRQSIGLLVKGAERSGIAGDEDFSRLGMSASLKALTPLYIAIKQMLALYGLGVDASLASVRVETVEQDGDQARVQVKYELAERPVQTVMQAVRIDGRWYLADHLQAARDSLGEPEAGPEADLETEPEAGQTPAAADVAAPAAR